MVIAEAFSGDTLECYRDYQFNRLLSEYRKPKLSLVDLNREAEV